MLSSTILLTMSCFKIKRRLGTTIHVSKYTKFDIDRSARTSFPEVVYGEGKTAPQIADIINRVHLHEMEGGVGGKPLITTRVSKDQYESIAGMLKDFVWDVKYYPEARLIATWAKSESDSIEINDIPAKVSVLMAGTSDFRIAEEAAITLELSNIRTVERVYDVGVAGIYRLLDALPKFQDSDCIIVCAGMDGALPSVVGGLVKCPIFAVPTSIGYGAAFGGISPLLTMLNTCAPGVSVVNIDNGFGAAVCAFKSCNITLRNSIGQAM